MMNIECGVGRTHESESQVGALGVQCFVCVYSFIRMCHLRVFLCRDFYLTCVLFVCLNLIAVWNDSDAHVLYSNVLYVCFIL